MKHSEYNWTKEGVKLFARCWEPEEVKGVVCIAHGFAEHSARYRHVAHYFGNKGMATLALDHIGHGKSEGKRGYTPSYDFMLDSIGDVLQEAGKRYPGKPVFLWGHSMGGNLVLNYLLRRNPQEIRGAIATGPLLKLGFDPPAVKIFLAKLMRHIYPAFVEKANLDTSRLARDPEVVAAYNADPLVHNDMTVSLFFPLFENGLWAIEQAGQLKQDVLLYHGTEDKLTSPEGSESFAYNAPQEKVTFKLWPGYYHELHNEPGVDKEAVLEGMTQWMMKRM